MVTIACLTPIARSGDISDEPVFYRVGFALERATNFTATAGMVASIANPVGGSENPAGLGFAGDQPITLTMTNATAVAESDAYFTVFAGTMDLCVPEIGTFTFAYARTDTFNQSTGNVSTVTGNRIRDELRSNEFFLGYGTTLNDNLAVGIEGRLVDANIEFEFDQGPVAVSQAIELLSFDLAAGALWLIDDHWSMGAVGALGYGEGDVDVRSLGGGLPVGTPIPGAPTDGVFLTWGAGLGIGYREGRQWGLYADLSFFHQEDDADTAADALRFGVGGHVRPTDILALRGGVLIDSDTDVTVSGGVGFYGIEGIPIDLAYQYNAFPELDSEFGTIHLLSVSVTIRF